LLHTSVITKTSLSPRTEPIYQENPQLHECLDIFLANTTHRKIRRVVPQIDVTETHTTNQSKLHILDCVVLGYLGNVKTM